MIAVAAPAGWDIAGINVAGLLIQLVIASVTSGLIIALLKLGPDRRKLGAEAGVSNATAADLLTGRALEMVKTADQRAQNADQRAEKAEQEAEAAKVKADGCEDRVRDLHHHLHFLVDYIRSQGLDVPHWPENAERP